MKKVALFRYIEYGILFVLTICLFVLTLINFGTSKPTKVVFGANMQTAAKANIQKLFDSGNSDSLKDDVSSAYDDGNMDKRYRAVFNMLGDGGFSKTYTEIEPVVKERAATVSLSRLTLKGADRTDFEKKNGAAELHYNDVVSKNVIAYVPSKHSSPTNNVIALVTHIDSPATSAGISDSLVSAGAMIEVAKYAKENADKSQNDFLFMFLDGHHYGSIGMQAVKKEFKGFKNETEIGAVDRIRLAVEFDSFGVDGPYSLINMSNNAGKVFEKLKSANVGLFAQSSLGDTLNKYNKNSDLRLLDDELPLLTFANIGNVSKSATAEDSRYYNSVVSGKNVLSPVYDNNFLISAGNMMQTVVSSFGNSNASDLSGKEKLQVFNYLNAPVSTYSNVIVYVLGGITLALVLAAIIYACIFKTLSWKGMLKGVFAAVLAIIGVCAFGFGTYYLIGSILSWCGVLDIRSLPTLFVSSTALTVVFGLFMTIVAVGVQILCKRALRCKAGDMVRGYTILWCVIGSIIAMALPQFSSLICFVAIAEAAILLAVAIAKPFYKKAVGEDIDRLFLPILPIIAMMPMWLTPILALVSLIGGWTMPLLLLIPVILAGVITPYFDYLKPVMNKVYSHIVGASVTSVETVTATVAQLKEKNTKAAIKALRDPKNAASVKKGNNGVVTYLKKTRQFQRVAYKSWHIIALLTFAFIVTLFGICGSTPAFTTNVSAVGADYNFYNDAIIYVHDSGNYYWKVADLDTYNTIKQTRKMTFDSKINAYKLADTDADNQSIMGRFLPTAEQIEGSEDKKFKIACLDSMRFDLTFEDVSSISEITVVSDTNDRFRSATTTHKPTPQEIKNNKMIVRDLANGATVTVKSLSGAKYAGATSFNGKQATFAQIGGEGDRTELRDMKKGLWHDIMKDWAGRETRGYIRGGVEVVNFKLNI